MSDQTTTSGPPPSGGARRAAAPPRGTGFFAALRRWPVRRRTGDRWVAGVCGGTADSLGIDAALVRVAAVVLALLGGVGLVAYGLAWLLVPEEAVEPPGPTGPAGAAGSPGRLEVEELVHGEVSAAAVGAIALVVLGSVVPGPWAWWTGPEWSGFPWGVVATLVVVVVLVSIARSDAARSGAARPEAIGATDAGDTSAGAERAVAGATAPAPVRQERVRHPRHPGPGPALASVLLGLALLAAGAGALAAWAGVLDVSGRVAAAGAAAAVLSLATVVLGMAGRDSGSVGASGGIAVVVLALAVLVPPDRAVRWFGDVDWRPTTTAAAEEGLTSVAGTTTVDLRDLDLAGGDRLVVPVRHGVGQLTVQVPSDPGSVVEVSHLLGGIRTGDLPAGWTVEGDLDDPGSTAVIAAPGTRPEDAELVVDVDAGIGDVRLEVLP